MEEVVNNSVKKLRKTMWIKFIILILINKLLKSMIFSTKFYKVIRWVLHKERMEMTLVKV